MKIIFTYSQIFRGFTPLTIIITLFTICVATSQSISGVVLDEINEPLLGASVIIKGTPIGTTTNMDGKFIINKIPVDAKWIIVSYVGYASKEVLIDFNNPMIISLSVNAQSIDEIVLIGYGSAKKKDVTGSVTSITAKEFQLGFVTNAEQLIANKVPGLQITPVSGRPGAGSSFLVRGGASLNASNNPLFVIDGNPIALSDGPGILSALNPDDIESFDVLKDAAAAAIYGSRGSNGVILITTKKGISNELKVTAATKFSVSQNIFKQSVLSGDQYREVAQNAAVISGIPVSNFNLGTANTDWQDEIYQTALTTESTMSIAGGIKGLPYRFSLGYLDQQGTLKTGYFKRTTVGLNLNPSFFGGKLKVDVNLKGSIQDERIADESAIFTATTFDPTQPVRDENSVYGGYWQYEDFASNPSVLGNHFNPVSKLEQVESRNMSLRSIGNLQLDYRLHFLPDLRINLNTGYDIAQSSINYFAPAAYFPANVSNGNFYSGDPASQTENVFIETTLNYFKAFKKWSGSVDGLIGYSYNDFKTTNFLYPSFDAVGNLQPNSEPNFPFDIPQSTLISYFGRMTYIQNDKYIITGTVRTDGSSRFSQNNRWGVFPAVSGAWKVSDEDFFKGFKHVSNLKLRIGYGITGQQEGIGNYGFRRRNVLGEAFIQYPIGNQFFQGILPQGTDVNRKWEQSTTYNVGVDWGFYDNRISGSFEVYLRKTDDLLNFVEIPSGTDFTNGIVKNIGSLENKGFEIKIDAIPIKSEKFNLYLGLSYGFNDNQITKLSDNNEDIGLAGGGIIVNAVGYQRNSFFLYRQVYDANGRPIENQMADLNSDGIINEKDRYVGESSVPRHNLGFNSRLNYKKWTLNMALHANLGGYLFFNPNDNLSSIYNGIFRGNIHTNYFDNQFTQNGNVNQAFSDHYLQNASFLKMDNISIIYELGNILNSKTPTFFTLSASVQNVFVITGFQGGDPESPFNFGTNFGGNYVAPRTFSTGINFNF
jgi:iron complex outermembrane receptor protein